MNRAQKYFQLLPKGTHFEKIIDTFKEIYKPGYINGAGGDFFSEAESSK